MAKEGVKFGDEDLKAQDLEQLNDEFEPLLTWLGDDVLSGEISKAILSDRLVSSPCALVASSYGWYGGFASRIGS